jgi:iron complex outermembrane receptor protein
VTHLDHKYSFEQGSAGLVGPREVANDPKYYAQLNSAMTLGERFSLNTDLRYVSALPNPRIAAYAEVNSRLAWNVTDTVQLALTGRNLLHDSHLEYTEGNRIPRSVSVDLQWRF